MASELVRMSSASTASSLCNFNNGSRRPLPLSPRCLAAGLNTALRRRSSRSLTSSSLSKLLGGVHLSYNTPPKLSALRKEQKRNFSVFAMAADGLSLSVVNFCVSFWWKMKKLSEFDFHHINYQKSQPVPNFSFCAKPSSNLSKNFEALS